MNHTTAEIMEFSDEPQSYLIHAEQLTAKKGAWSAAEKQHQAADFFKKLLEALKNYDEVLLFGPTEAKSEFLHFIRKHHHYDAIKIEVRNTDVLTEKQRHIFVTEYFKRFDVVK